MCGKAVPCHHISSFYAPKCKVSQHADDTTLLLDGSELSLQKAFELLGKFGCISGLKVNCEKTKALWIGKLRHRNNAVLTDIKIK